MTARLALALLFTVPAALAYPYETLTQRWVLAVAVAVVTVLFAWWRGDFAATKLARQWSIRRGNRAKVRDFAEAGDSATVVLRFDDSASVELPVALIAGYADRYGLRLDKVRITSRDRAAERRSWITLTLDAAQNLPALQARSERIPLHGTADITGRRLADHLRESGWTVSVREVVPRPVFERGQGDLARADRRGGIPDRIPHSCRIPAGGARRGVGAPDCRALDCGRIRARYGYRGGRGALGRAARRRRAHSRAGHARWPSAQGARCAESAIFATSSRPSSRRPGAGRGTPLADRHRRQKVNGRTLSCNHVVSGSAVRRSPMLGPRSALERLA